MQVFLKQRRCGEYDHTQHDKRAYRYPNAVDDFFIFFVEKHFLEIHRLISIKYILLVE